MRTPSPDLPVPTRPQHRQHREAEQHEAPDRDPRRNADVVLHEGLATEEGRRDRRSGNQRASTRPELYDRSLLILQSHSGLAVSKRIAIARNLSSARAHDIDPMDGLRRYGCATIDRACTENPSKSTFVRGI